MSSDCSADLQRNGKSGATILGCHFGRGTLSNRAQERLQFDKQRLAGGNLELAHGESGYWMRWFNRLERDRSQTGRGGLAQFRSLQGWNVDAKNILARVIDGDVLMGLKEADLPNPLCADAAGGEIGDTTGLKFDANIRDIDF